jgi:hypothetical protein
MRAPNPDATTPTMHQCVPVRKSARANAAIAPWGRPFPIRIMATRSIGSAAVRLVCEWSTLQRRNRTRDARKNKTEARRHVQQTPHGAEGAFAPSRRVTRDYPAPFFYSPESLSGDYGWAPPVSRADRPHDPSVGTQAHLLKGAHHFRAPCNRNPRARAGRAPGSRPQPVAHKGITRATREARRASRRGAT